MTMMKVKVTMKVDKHLMSNDMKQITYIFVCLAFSFITACSTIEKPEITNICIGVEDLDFDISTKASIAIESNAPQFYWKDTDEVGIFPNAGGYQLGFSLQGQGGKKNGSFNGGGWALRPDVAYSTYYPFCFENKNPECIPVSYLGQVQNGDESLEHLGDYFFCATEPTSSTDGRISFTLRNIGALVWFAITLPDSDSYSEISLVTDGNLFTTEGSYDLKNFVLELSPTKTSDRISLKLENVSTTSANQVINAYMMVAPFDLTGHEYKLYVKTTGGIYYSADLASKNHVLARNGSRKISATVELSDGYNMGIGEWGNGGSISGGAE